MGDSANREKLEVPAPALSPEDADRSSVRLLETRSGTGTTELLGLASAGVGDEEELVVLQQQLLQLALLSLVVVLLVESDDRFGNCLSDGEDLGGRATTTDAHADVHVLELVTAQEEEWLEHLQPEGGRLQDVHGLAVHSHDAGAWGAVGHSGRILLSSEGLHLLRFLVFTHLSQIWVYNVVKH